VLELKEIKAIYCLHVIVEKTFRFVEMSKFPSSVRTKPLPTPPKRLSASRFHGTLKVIKDIKKPCEWEGSIDEWVELGEKLGEGAYGAVYAAVLKSSKEPLAVKCVELGVAGEDIEDLEKEIDLLRQCAEHVNVVSLFGSVKDLQADKLWVMMELATGGSLRDIMETIELTYEEDQIAYVCRATLEALAYLHSKHIIHRDCKAANILLSEHGVVKLADFGISKQQVTTDTVVGTPLWYVVVDASALHFVDRNRRVRLF
jgi:serine/threonine protein kinase